MKRKIVLSLFLCLLVAGCASELATQKKQCLDAQNNFTLAIQMLTLYKAKFSEQQKQEITVFIEAGQNCLNNWNNSFKDPNIPSADWLACVTNIVETLNKYLEQAKGGA